MQRSQRALALGTIVGGLLMLLPAASRAEGYFGLGGGLLAGKSTHGWNVSCPSQPGVFETSCSTGAPVGFVADARLGLRFGPLGLEGFAMGAGDWSSASMNALSSVPVPDYLKSMNIGRVGGGFGGGARLMFGNNFLGFTGGAGAGVLFRHVYTNVSSLSGSSVDYSVPIARADASLLLFGVLSVGAIGWMEFTPQVNVTPDFSELGAVGTQLAALAPSITVFEGTEYFIGPYVGLRFGEAALKEEEAKK